MGSLFPIQIIPDRIIYYAYFFEFKIVEKNLRRFDLEYKKNSDHDIMIDQLIAIAVEIETYVEF